MLNFVRINEYIIKAEDICYIKETGCGCHIACKFGTIDITNLEEGELDCIYAKLNEVQELEPCLVGEAIKEEATDTPEINCSWSHCRMCTYFSQTIDYATCPGVVRIRCSRYGWKGEIEEETLDTFSPDDWEGLGRRKSK